MDNHLNNGDDSNHNGAQQQQPPSPTSSPSEAFSECMSHLLMSAEELRRNCMQATSSKNRPDGTTANSSGVMIQPDNVFCWQAGLENCLPVLDQLARWTADVANPQSVESDLFQHCQSKAVAVAQQVLETALKFSEAAIMEEAQEESNNSSGVVGGGIISGEIIMFHGEPIEEVLRNVQGAIARITELCLVLIAGSSHTDAAAASTAEGQKKKLATMETVLQSYVSYQRQVLRQRSRPEIAKLVQIRKQQQQQQQAAGRPLHHQQHHDHDDDDDDDDDDGPAGIVLEQHHGSALTVILGQAAALVHPLIVWKMTLLQQIQQQLEESNGNGVHEGMLMTAALYRLCTEAITTLDEQTCKLTKTVSDWFYEDRPVEAYMQKCASEESIPQSELSVLDGLVEEMAFGCQVLARYHALVVASSATTTSVNHHPSLTKPENEEASSSSPECIWVYQSLTLPQTLDTIIERELVPEWTWKYAALERFLAVQQWQSALVVAQPVQIVMGTQIHVPSVVEDAQYLSTRALERAASTQSTQAIGTVAHAVSHDVWSTEEQLALCGVHQALLEERGCWASAAPTADEGDNGKKKSAPDSSNDFAAALLDALDEDLGGSTQTSPRKSPPHSSKSPPRSHPSAPTSGGFLTSSFLGVGSGGAESDQVLLETCFCVLNGIHAAAGACRSLVEFLDTLLINPDDADEGQSQPNSANSSDSKATAMIQLAREELFRYANDYDGLLSTRFEDTTTIWCGTGHVPVSRSRRRLCFDELRAFIAGEDYNIDVGAMKKAESDERLERGVIGPLNESLFFRQLSNRCESDVLNKIGQVMVTKVVDLVLDALWSSEKKVTDWGSLLLSKEVRLLQGSFSKILAQDSADGAGTLLATGGAAPSNSIHQWERLSQVCNVLQLEQPAEWLMYLDSSVLPAEDLEKTMSLRLGWSRDAIQSVVATAKQRMQETEASRTT